MMGESNIIVLTGFLCNGKTSMLYALKTILSSRFQNKKIIIVDEPVRFLLEDIEEIMDDVIIPKRDFDFYHRQASFMATSLAQFEIIRGFLFNSDYIVICDRCFIDPFVYTYLNYPDDIFEEKRDKLLNLLGLYNIELSFDFQFYYLKLPERDDVLQKCFNDDTRRATVNFDDIRSKEKEFYNKYCKFVEKRLDRYTHPADNSYVVYEIADEIIERLS